MMPKWFTGMNGREQVFLLCFQWAALFSVLIILTRIGIDAYGTWSNAGTRIEGHLSVLDLRPAIDAALIRHKKEQENISYDRRELSDRSSSLSAKVFPSRAYRELDSEERERYKQHTVRITFKKASYESVNEFAALIRKESPFMFLSEVEVEPNYPPKNKSYETITYDAVFHVSSVEFADG
jgi:hypothetical protein